MRSLGPEACADLIDEMLGDGTAREGSGAVVAYLRRHAAEIGGGPSMGTVEAEQQHTYKSRMASVPMAWSREGADAMARVRSWVVFSQVSLAEKSAPFFRVSSRKFFGFRRGHVASFLTCPA